MGLGWIGLGGGKGGGGKAMFCVMLSHEACTLYHVIHTMSVICGIKFYVCMCMCVCMCVCM